MLFNKIYLINLLRKPGNLSKMFDILAKTKILGEIPIDVVKAYDGEDIDENYLKNIDAKVWPHWKDPWFGRTITKGEIGCALSHNEVWRRVIEGKDEPVLVLEDDVILSEGFLKQCEEIEHQMSGIDWELFYLGRKPIFSEKEERIKKNVVLPLYSYWTIGYALTKNGANKLFNTNYMKNIIPVDEYIPYLYGRPNEMIRRRFNYTQNLNAYAVDPSIVSPNENAFKNSETEKSEPYVSSNGKEFDSNIKVLTVATENNDGLRLLLDSAKKFGIKVEVLGLDKEWNDGGNKPRLDYPGGGQKVNLLKEKLKEFDDDDIVVFTDAYDVVYNSNLNEMIGKFKSSGSDLVFGAEFYCWPDENLKRTYPLGPNDKHFLNSGVFIGYVKKLKEVTSPPINDEDDDQLYYTHRFLERVNMGDMSVGLDYLSHIFQTCLANKAEALRVDGTKSRFWNATYKTIPSIIHGNGDILNKMELQKASNHLINFRTHYGYCKSNSAKKIEKDKPTIFVNLNFDKRDPNDIMRSILSLDYPRDRMILHANTTKGQEFKVDGVILNGLMEFSKFVLTNNNPALENMNNGAFLAASKFDFDYMFSMDEDCDLRNQNLFEDLIALDKDFVSPLLAETSSPSYSNIWPSSKENFEKIGDNPHLMDYENIIDRRLSGCWAVPYVDRCFFVKSHLISKIKDFYKRNLDSPVMENLDSAYNKEKIAFCANMIEQGLFMYVDNQKFHGSLLV